MIIRYFGLVIILWFLLVGCQEEIVNSEITKCESKEKIELCNLSSNLQIVLDTFSSAQIISDSLTIKGKAYIKYLNTKEIFFLKWKGDYLPFRTGRYEINTGINSFINVYSGGSRLETKKLRIDIESGSQLKYINGNHVLIPLSDDYPNWIPDSLLYK